MVCCLIFINIIIKYYYSYSYKSMLESYNDFFINTLTSTEML